MGNNPSHFAVSSGAFSTLEWKVLTLCHPIPSHPMVYLDSVPAGSRSSSRSHPHFAHFLVPDHSRAPLPRQLLLDSRLIRLIPVLFDNNPSFSSLMFFPPPFSRMPNSQAMKEFAAGFPNAPRYHQRALPCLSRRSVIPWSFCRSPAAPCRVRHAPARGISQASAAAFRVGI